MKHVFSILFFCCLSIAIGCRQKMDDDEVLSIGIIPCQQQPRFLTGTGLNPARSAFSTSEKRIKGLALIQISENNIDTAGRKTWQHPSWSRFGFMGSITTDENGNVYTAPFPVINVLDNPVEKQNIIYKVATADGDMKPLVNLPMATKPDSTNVFGLMGLFYDCHGKILYASSIAGSTREKENGIIYAVDPVSGKIIDQIAGNDAMGLCVGGITGVKRLYFGSSRTADIYSVELTKGGSFTGPVKKEFTLDLLGPRGDDKARRIRFDQQGIMNIFGVEFDYNLTAPSEKQETIYRFRYDDEEKKWTVVE